MFVATSLDSDMVQTVLLTGESVQPPRRAHLGFWSQGIPLQAGTSCAHPRPCELG